MDNDISFKCNASRECIFSFQVTKSNTEVTEGSPAESYCQEDCVVIDGIAFRVVDCIENITNKFKEIDSLMAEFQNV